jgi:hypothetical protein
MPRLDRFTPEGKVIPRSFNATELQQIKELRTHMTKATNVWSWNSLRDEAKQRWGEKIISAVDGLRKWAISYDKPTKVVTYLCVKL